jgi:[ribosomal protein S5]-alanine N-acetyltransferase
LLTPEITGFDVRPLRLGDAQAWADYVCLPEVMQHTSSTARSVDDVMPIILRCLQGTAESPIRFGLWPQGTDRLIGTVGFHTISALNASAEISYDIAPSHWGRGIASAACRAATAWGLAQRGWHRIQATTLPANLASQRVLVRCGYQREGLLRHFRMVRGTPADYWMFSVIASRPQYEGGVITHSTTAGTLPGL